MSLICVQAHFTVRPPLTLMAQGSSLSFAVHPLFSFNMTGCIALVLSILHYLQYAGVQTGPDVLLPRQPSAATVRASADIHLLVGPDFSLRCVHPGKSMAAVGVLLSLHTLGCC